MTGGFVPQVPGDNFLKVAKNAHKNALGSVMLPFCQHINQRKFK